jgi:hypothetical protein
VARRASAESGRGVIPVATQVPAAAETVREESSLTLGHPDHVTTNYLTSNNNVREIPLSRIALGAYRLRKK